MHSVWDTVFDFDPETVPIRSPSPERTSPSSRRTLARVAKVVPVISPSSQPTALSYPRSPLRLSPDESLSQRVEIRGERLCDVLRARGHLQQSPRLPRVPHAHVAQRGANVRRRSAVPSESARGGRRGPAARETCGVSPQAFLPPSQDAKRRAKQTESKRGVCSCCSCASLPSRCARDAGVARSLSYAACAASGESLVAANTASATVSAGVASASSATGTVAADAEPHIPAARSSSLRATCDTGKATSEGKSSGPRALTAAHASVVALVLVGASAAADSTSRSHSCLATAPSGSWYREK